MDKVPICILEVKEGRKKEREVRLKQGEEKKKKIEKIFKNSFKKFIKRNRSKEKVSNYICTSLHDHTGHFVHLLTEASNEGSMY